MPFQPEPCGTQTWKSIDESLLGFALASMRQKAGNPASAGAPAAALDFQENYLRGVFGFLGITDIEFVRAEGLNYGPAQREQAMTAALNSIAAELPLAA